jgi:hypothetical protein
MSLEMAQKVIVPQKKNYVPQFLKQRDINSYISDTVKLKSIKYIFWQMIVHNTPGFQGW